MAFSLEKYPYTSEFDVVDFVPVELSHSNYREWKELILDFIESRGLLGFINGKVKPLPKWVTVDCEFDDASDFDFDSDSDSSFTDENETEEYKSWKRSDALVRGWIITTLTRAIVKQVRHFNSAEQVWTALEKMFDPAKAFPRRVKELEKELGHYQPLHIDAIKGDWKRALKFIEQEPDAVRAKITISSQTALHVSISSARRTHFVKKLVEKMAPEDLALADNFGRTALHIAAAVGIIEAAKLLVDKNPKLPNVWDLKGLIPLHHAASHGNREMFLYLLDVTSQDVELKTLNKSGGQLLCDLANSGLYDIALFMLERYPKLACMEGPSPLMVIAEKRSSFRSGTPLNYWQALIYSNVPTKLENIAKHHRGGDIENPAGCFISVKQRLRAMFWEVAEKIVPQMKYIREKKLIHHQALKLVKFICMEVANSKFSKASQTFAPALFKATSFGIHEIVEEILESCPHVIFVNNLKKQSIFEDAIVWRCENVFNLMYQLEESSWMLLSRKDQLGNNGLHLAGCLGPQQQLRGSAAGAALQLQRELQWFKEVEKKVLPIDKEMRNTLGKTPALVFTSTHKELIKEGERWMKDTANSCIIIATLIAIVVFIAAITVPGLNNNDNGQPFFSKQKAFVIFGIFDTFALFSSLASVLMFFSILIARYAEEDFLYALPKRLIIGLGTLFVSIFSTMIVFGATLCLVFRDNNAWNLIPIVALGCLPVTLFVTLQLPLLIEMIKSTYGPGIFGRQSDRMLL